MKVNPGRKPGRERQRRLAFNTEKLSTTPAAKADPNVVPYVPFDLFVTADIGGEVCSLGSA